MSDNDFTNHFSFILTILYEIHVYSNNNSNLLLKDYEWKKQNIHIW
jgi:hypothetical protein